MRQAQMQGSDHRQQETGIKQEKSEPVSNLHSTRKKVRRKDVGKRNRMVDYLKA